MSARLITGRSSVQIRVGPLYHLTMFGDTAIAGSCLLPLNFGTSSSISDEFERLSLTVTTQPRYRFAFYNSRYPLGKPSLFDQLIDSRFGEFRPSLARPLLRFSSVRNASSLAKGNGGAHTSRLRNRYRPVGIAACLFGKARIAEILHIWRQHGILPETDFTFADTCLS